jgi:hypothetical protein
MKAAHRSGLFSALNFSLVSAQFVNDLLSSFIAHPSSLILVFLWLSSVA